MNHVITGVDVYSDIDPTRPIASILRVGGGVYAVRLLTESRETIDRPKFDTIELALEFCEAISYHVESDPENPAYKVAVLSLVDLKNEKIKELEARLAELEG